MRLLAAASLLALAACSPAAEDAPADPMAVHKGLLVLDTHLDTGINFDRPGWSFGDRHTPANDLVQLDARGKVERAKMVAASPLADFSYDYQDLDLRPVGDTK